MKRPRGVLYLIPNTLGGAVDTVSTPTLRDAVLPLTHFVAEEFRSARRLLRGLGYTREFETVSLELLNEHTPLSDLPTLLQPALDGNDMGLLSEAGCPCVADPGSALVRMAHQHKIRVRPLGVPSSIILTLMASGLTGQNFSFTGYLPRDRSERIRRIKQLEQLALHSNQTQLFMDAPYRNNQVVEDILGTCQSATLLCIGADLTTQEEYIYTTEVGAWKGHVPNLHKHPVIFALGK